MLGQSVCHIPAHISLAYAYLAAQDPKMWLNGAGDMHVNLIANEMRFGAREVVHETLALHPLGPVVDGRVLFAATDLFAGIQKSTLEDHTKGMYDVWRRGVLLMVFTVAGRFTASATDVEDRRAVATISTNLSVRLGMGSVEANVNGMEATLVLYTEKVCVLLILNLYILTDLIQLLTLMDHATQTAAITSIAQGLTSRMAVSPSASNSTSAAETLPPYNVSDGDVKPLDVARKRALSTASLAGLVHVPKRRRGPNPNTEERVANVTPYLTLNLKATEGYTPFLHSKGRQHQPDDLVNFWSFAVAFVAKYAGKWTRTVAVSTTTVCRSECRLTCVL